MLEPAAATSPPPLRRIRFPWTLPAAWAVAGAGVAALSLLGAPRPAASGPADPPVTPEQAAFFESKVRPLLIEACVPCHNKDASMGGLRLDARAALLKGGDTGSSLVPGDPDHSLLITAVRQTGPLKMPQGGKLAADKIAVLEAWVKIGAPWPASASDAATAAAKPAAWRSFWSFQPVTAAPRVPAVKNRAGVRSPIDAFVLAKLEAKGLTLAAPADRRTLLRRVTFDLTGLPPTPDEVAAFVTDRSPDAYEKVVDRLLDSPRYGERWARHWLDIARYADTKGYVFVEDRAYPHAYTYRDWVIRSFNEDLPYDRFLTYQLAADLAPEVKDGEDKRPLAALGFLTIGRRFLNNPHDIADDRIDVTMRGFQGLTVACARCHDHKFDPIPTADYYALYGVLSPTVLNEHNPPISPRAVSEPWERYHREKSEAEHGRNELVRAEVKRLREAGKAAPASLPEPVKKTLASFRESELPDAAKLGVLLPAFTPDAALKLAGYAATLDRLAKSVPPTPELAMAVADKPDPESPVVFKRGNPANRGEAVPRRWLTCLTPPARERPEWKSGGSGRLELARAMASRDNPLTARVMANRVWLHHFGQGLVRTPSDFGKQGERPTHPELLDWLAWTFMQDGWSVKKLHRRIVLSDTYRQGSVAAPRALAVDPENRLLARQNRRRLDLEQMRDALLWASGRLDTAKVGGKSEELWGASYTARRAVYGYVERQNLPGTFRTFDFASPDATSPQRFRTTVPQQALFLLNSPFAVDQAAALAKLTAAEGASDDARRVRTLYRRLFGRAPDADELAAGVAYLRSAEPSAAAPDAAPVWSYGLGAYDEAARRVSSFVPFGHYNAGARQRQPEATFPLPSVVGYAMLNAAGGHPGSDAAHAVIRRWTAPFDAVVSVRGTLRHPSAQGDGVRGRLVSSRTGPLGEWVAQNGAAETNVARVAMKKGDTLDFVADCRTEPAFDSFLWSPIITVAEGTNRAPAVARWSAETGFTGPRPPAPASLARAERYAQALLMTNEFMFVD